MSVFAMSEEVHQEELKVAETHDVEHSGLHKQDTRNLGVQGVWQE